MPELPKTYEPAAIEEKWYAEWLARDFFHADPASPKPAYSIVIPPPNVTGMLTLGHVLNNTIQDILARRARMLGKEVLWLPGTDHAGIATQTVVERTLKKQGVIKHRDDLGREKFLEKVWEWKEQYGGIIIQQLKKLGASCDWARERFTMDAEYSRCVQQVFVDLYKKGMIYRGKRMVNWCPVSRTALSDEEVIMKPQNGVMYYFTVEVARSAAESPRGGDAAGTAGDADVAATGTTLTVATTRPETIPGDTAIAVNPKDERYAHLIGRWAIRPLPVQVPDAQKLIPIIGDEAVDFAFGTGVLKVTPAHDRTDFEIGQRHALAVIDVMNPDGTMNALAGESLVGLDRFEARKVAVEHLRDLGVLVKEEPHANNVGYSERADVPIEPRLSEQWFLKYPSVERARGCVAQPQAAEKTVEIVELAGSEIRGESMNELRESALSLARARGWLGHSFKNADSGIELRVRRKSLSHAFSNRGEVNVWAVAALPDLIRTARHVSSEPHEPPHPDFCRVHRFVAALKFHGGFFRIHITGKELKDGTVLYDHRAKKIALGGQSLVPSFPRETVGSQPAPSATLQLGELMENVNGRLMKFFPERWAKVYDHWLGGIQDWCISRQLWWGHRIPVWSITCQGAETTRIFHVVDQCLDYTLEEHLQQNAECDQESLKITNMATGELLRPTLMDFNHGLGGTRVQVQVAQVGDEVGAALERNGFIQDSDVLDTWFSSWLWPFATMGWPEKTPTLAKFYPTTDLVTGPDIIFFWVARMIMAGYEWTGEMPFQNVYFTGIIRDKQGRKMSKSLGNSPDPLEIIARFGADALRFGVMRSAPLGADVLFDEKNVELGRNFCTKLWNAARFREMQGGETEGEINPALLTSDDQWILLRLDAAIREVSLALEEYRFSDAAQGLYRFFWNEYCDWYVEASKAVLNSDDAPRKANALAVMDFVLGHTLRLFHPFMPFITEELWHGMGFNGDLPAKQGGETIMFAHWPSPLDADFKAHYGLTEENDRQAQAKYEVVNLGRGLRRDFNIASNKRVRFVLQPTAPLAAPEVEVLRLLLNAEPLDIPSHFAAPKGTPTVLTPLGDLFLPLEGLIDVAAERERLQKEIEKVQAELLKVRAKLADESFAAKVPAKVLEEHQQREESWAGKLAQFEKMREALG